jgi:hypothetical protein
VHEWGAWLVGQKGFLLVALLAAERGFLWVDLSATEMDLSLAVSWDKQ